MNSSNIFSANSTVLIIKPRAIGDILLSTPVVTNLKRFNSQLQIDFLCEGFAADVVHGNDNISNVLTFDKKKDSSAAIISSVRKRKYDVVIDLFCNPRTALITYFSGAKYRIGFPFRGRGYAYNIKVEPRGGKVHNVDFNLDVVKKFDIPIVDSSPHFPLNEQARQFAAEWILSQKFLYPTIVGINPSGGWYTKKWKTDLYALLADRIYEVTESNIVFFWGPGEQEDVKKIQRKMINPSVLIPKTSLKEMGALLQHCHYLVSNDSGPMHVAASLGVPTLGIFGPTNPLLQGPYGGKHMWVRHEELDCLACNLTECPIGNVCMTDLSVDVVFNAFYKLVMSNPV